MNNCILALSLRRKNSEFDKFCWVSPNLLTYFSPSKGVSIHSTVPEGAHKLNEHLTKFEEYKGWYPYAYNTFGEKVSAFFKRMFGIRK